MSTHQPYARTQPDPSTLAAVRRLLAAKAGHAEAERIRALLNQARAGGLLSQEVADDARQRLEVLAPAPVEAPIVEQAAEHLTRRFEVVPNGFGGTTTRVRKAAAPATAPSSRGRTKQAAALVRWVAEGYMDQPNDEVRDNGACRRCAGTGDFITGMHNGKPVGPGGPCFRCSGKGMQSDCGGVKHREIAAGIEAGERDTTACCDRVRNGLYDTYGIRIYA